MDRREIERSIGAFGHIARRLYMRLVPDSEYVDAQTFWEEIKRELIEKDLLASCSAECLAERVVVRARAKIRDELRRTRIGRRVHCLLWKLPPRQVSIVSLLYLEREPIERIAEWEGLTVDEVRAELRDARRTMNKFYRRELRELEKELEVANCWQGWLQCRINVLIDGTDKVIRLGRVRKGNR